LGDVQSSIRALPQLVDESINAGVDSSTCDFSGILRGLAQSFLPEPNELRRISLLFCEPPDTLNDTDIHGALNALLVADICCDFIFLSQDESSDDTSQRLGELALLVSSYANCALARIRASHAIDDMSRVRSSWHNWVHPPKRATLRLPGQTALQVRLVPLLIPPPIPEPESACTCHNLLVARPARCAITGRKPTERNVYAYKMGGTHIKASDNNDDSHELVVIGAIPSSNIDSCYVLGDATYIVPALPASEDFLSALSVQLQHRNESVIIKLKSRFQTSMHIASAIQLTDDPGVPGPLVLIRVAAREDVLMAQTTANTGENGPSPLASRVASELLDALPRTAGYNPLAFTNNLSLHFQSFVMAEAQNVSTASAQYADHNQPQPQLTKKMIRLNLQ
jgi:hypothetical protein